MNVCATFQVKSSGGQKNCSVPTQSKNNVEGSLLYMSTQLCWIHKWVMFSSAIVYTALPYTHSVWQYCMLHNHISWPISWSSLPLYNFCFLFIISIIICVRVVPAASLVSNLIAAMWWECNWWCFQALGWSWFSQLDLHAATRCCSEI